MKNILKSLVIVAAVCAVSGGATYAYFSDTATSSGNTFSAGNLAISLGDSCRHFDGYFDNYRHWHNPWDDCSNSARFDVDNAEPGTCENKTVNIRNTGSLVARDLSVSVANVHGDLCPALVSKIGDNVLGTTPISISNPTTINPRGNANITINVCFPNDTNNAQDQYQNKSCSFDLTVGAKAYTE